MLVATGFARTARARLFGRFGTRQAVLEALLLGGASLYVLAFLGAAVFRLSFPYPLEITEGASLAELREILHGQPLYVAPTLEHVPMIYGPVYYYAAGLFALAAGPTYLALRIVALLASICSLTLIGLIVQRETGSRMGAIVAAGVFAASYPLTDGTLDLGRVDALMLALLLGALYAARAEDARSPAVAGVLAALAVLTKQAAAPVALLLPVYLFAVDRRRAYAYVVSGLLIFGLVVAVLGLQSGRWVTYFLLQLPRNHAIDPLRLDQFWKLGVLPHYTLALPLGALFLYSRVLARDRLAVLFFGLAGLGMSAIAWASDSNPGASENVLLPAYAMLSIMFGLGLAEGVRLLGQLRGQPRDFSAFAVSVGILQLALMIYNPRLMVPYRSDEWADDRLASTLSGLPGTIFAPDYDAYLQQRAERTEQPFSGAFAELVGGYGGTAQPEGTALLQTLRERLLRREYDYVVLAPDSQFFFFSTALQQAGYVDAGALFPPDDEFWLWRGSTAPRSELYVPQERLSS